MISRARIKSGLYSRIFVKPGKQRVEKVFRKSITVNWAYAITFAICYARSRHDQQLPNLCSMEINEIRPFFVRAMGVLTQLTRDPAADSRQFDVWFRGHNSCCITSSYVRRGSNTAGRQVRFSFHFSGTLILSEWPWRWLGPLRV